MRRADAAQLEAALGEGRTELLALFDGFEAALGAQGLHIAFDPSLNLPLWELGHIGWFEEWWIGRNPDRARGIHFDATLPRTASLLPSADACYDSANVPHASRWDLALPDAGRTRAYLAAVRAQTLELLREAGSDDDALYFFRLVLFHEDMHREAWLMMAQQLGLHLAAVDAKPTARPALRGVDEAARAWAVDACASSRVGDDLAGFAFDNELAPPPQVVERSRSTAHRSPGTASCRSSKPAAMQTNRCGAPLAGNGGSGAATACLCICAEVPMAGGAAASGLGGRSIRRRRPCT